MERFRGFSPEDMNFEFPRESEREKRENGVEIPPEDLAVDRGWFNRYQEIARFSLLGLFQGDAEIWKDQRSQFEDGKIRNPDLNYPKIDQGELSDKYKALIALKREIRDVEKEDFIVKAYRWKINEVASKVGMAMAAGRGDMRRFERYAKFIYGEPSRDVFYWEVDRMRQEVEDWAQSDDPELKSKAEALLDNFPQREGYETFQLPSEETVDFAREKTMEQYGDLINFPGEPGDKVGTEELLSSMKEVVKEMDALGWQVVEDKSGNWLTCAVDQATKEAIVPEGKTTTIAGMKNIIMHEILTHIGRRTGFMGKAEDGEAEVKKSRLLLAGVGLDRSEQAEEGITTMRTKMIKDDLPEVVVPGLYHLAAGLAQGVDGTPRDFRGVYDMVRDYQYCKQLSSGQEKEKAEINAKNTAWKIAVRFFRGTNCSTPGVYFPKDIIYQEGHIGIWRVIGEKPDELIKFNIAKYDPGSDRHLWILEQAGTTDRDLEELAS